ncbi:NAD(P)-dependent oxidoreductase [Thiomicrorhabdus sp. Kp2]|uniref:NAD-dependent epimerase/dehydratase family protein n=1 Tax=Thiomicrorhabdus sp. Kp2 TaxID=1123518 RepID=UPI0003FEF078|nr:NAD(P)-dependent oxidoreductase [Thiomicrorhabdus sp. Kp2]
MQNLRTILLTGATGFIGSHLLEALIRQGYSVVVLKRSTSNLWRIDHLAGQYKSYDVDLQSILDVFDSEKIDVVIHLATLYRKFDNGHEVDEMIQSNVSFPLQLVETGVRKGVKAFINTGTFFEYDCSTLPVKETSKVCPYNFYAKSKIIFEEVLKTYSSQIAINTFRLFSPYGEMDNHKLVSMIINKAINDDVIELSEGLQKIDFIYVKDIVQAYVKAIERLNSRDWDAEYEVFNLGSGIALSIRDLVSVVEECLGQSVKKIWGEPSLLDIPIAFADTTKIRQVLGWEPEYTIHKGIKNTISYYKENSRHGN